MKEQAFMVPALPTNARFTESPCSSRGCTSRIPKRTRQVKDNYRYTCQKLTLLYRFR